MRRWVALFAVLVAACGSSSASKVASVSTSAAPSSSSSTSASTATATSTKAAVPHVVLAADGLDVATDDATGHITHLKFGTDQPTIKTALQSALGAPQSVDPPTHCEDGSDRSFGMIRYTGLSVSFLAGRLAGWLADQASFTTAGGIGPGSTRAQVDKAFPGMTVDETSSLGVEFSTGSLSGILDGTAKTSKVDAIWAGDTCIIR